MKYRIFVVLTLFGAASLCAQQSPSPAPGEDTTALLQKIRDLEDRVVMLEGKVRTLQSNTSSPAPAAAPEATTQTATPLAPTQAAEAPPVVGLWVDAMTRSGRPLFANLTDKGTSVTLTYWPSEFSQVRGQYRYTDYAEGIKANEFLMRLIFSLGAHGAHPYLRKI